MTHGIVEDVSQRDGSGRVRPADDGDDRLREQLADDLDAGFAVLVGEHGSVVYSVARQLCANRADAEDLAAESFLRAYRALRGYDRDRLRSLRPRPWLLTILRNTARNAARDRARRPDPPPAFEPVEQPDGRAGVEQQAESAEAQRALGVLLARLPEVQRSAVVLRHVVGLGTGEVAEVLGCAEGTAKSHVSRGLRRLRALAGERPGAREEGSVR